ncbi:hypothetical protein LX36DRAFT_657931 [Colletotrichum falcatum]|nr:hypothetical protein LX36DRAFT_657931 [Colletotrichum falcatum]
MIDGGDVSTLRFFLVNIAYCVVTVYSTSIYIPTPYTRKKLHCGASENRSRKEEEGGYGAAEGAGRKTPKGVHTVGHD